MIIEELAARFGISVEGIQKLRAAIKQVGVFRKEVKKTVNPLKVSGASAALVAAGVDRVGLASKKSSRSVLLLSTAMTRMKAGAVAVGRFLRTLLMVLLRLAPAALGVVAGLGAIALGFARAGAAAARARREFNLTAKSLGTTGQNLETATNIFRYLGLGDDAKGEAEKAIGAINDVLKAIRAGGDEAKEAREKFAGLGLAESFKVDMKTGQMRDAAAVLLDIVAAYKQMQEQAGAYRKQADDIAKKQPKRASDLRNKALERDRKAAKLAEDSGIDGKLKVLLDEKSWPQIAERISQGARQRPTTSDASETAQKSVAEQAEQASLKAGALLKGTTDRLEELGVALATKVLPPVNDFLDKALSFSKAIGLIPENKAEERDRLSYERAKSRADGNRAERKTTEELAADAARSQTRFETGIQASAARARQRREQSRAEAERQFGGGTGWLDYFRTMLSPETNASKLQKTAEQSADNRRYENFGNDQRQMPISIQQTLQQDAAAIAAATKSAVLGAISTKGANTSTGALTAP